MPARTFSPPPFGPLYRGGKQGSETEEAVEGVGHPCQTKPSLSVKLLLRDGLLELGGARDTGRKAHTDTGSAEPSCL